MSSYKTGKADGLSIASFLFFLLGVVVAILGIAQTAASNDWGGAFYRGLCFFGVLSAIGLVFAIRSCVRQRPGISTFTVVCLVLNGLVSFYLIFAILFILIVGLANRPTTIKHTHTGPQTVMDSNRRIIGYIETQPDGTQVGKDANYRIKGYYDPKQNVTKDANYRIVGHANLLYNLINSP